MLVGRSAVMQELREKVLRVAQTPFTVLVEGESGAGKELVARELHRLGPRRRGPFVAVNCAALVESLLEAELFGIEDRTATGVRGRKGKFELADQGTLFLDEVGDLSAPAQAKLLRALQDMTVERVGGTGARPIDVRVIAATNRVLPRMVDAGTFRLDLYYRLTGIDLFVPPLRERREDIGPLVDHLLGAYESTRQLEVGLDALQAMLLYDWPGNVRQLARVLERAVALAPGPVVTRADLPEQVAGACAQGVPEFAGEHTLRAWSGRYVRLVLERCHGNKSRACELLDISYNTLRSYLQPAQGSDAPLRRPRAAGALAACRKLAG